MNFAQLLPILGMLVVFYLIIFIPESRRRKKFNNMIANLRVNDQIITKGGIVGKITNIQDKEVTMQTGPDKVKIKIAKAGIMSVLTERKTSDVSKK
ncbi:preprotein translocase subunit YajC [Clostridium sp. cel8]|jgi:preprotein translocase subunit YajC|uniref:preprotein translocase subunit YajC n=1 Tax=unclassified Clostridium TaxID=2614128 RepID=UPI0015F4397A|nr:preprotein translocase subunit YajC [Clostridium sp. cel8]MBA5850931.1 preprotein translocase subunit YajC [Clostridium sp. cel8]